MKDMLKQWLPPTETAVIAYLRILQAAARKDDHASTLSQHDESPLPVSSLDFEAPSKVYSDEAEKVLVTINLNKNAFLRTPTHHPYSPKSLICRNGDSNCLGTSLNTHLSTYRAAGVCVKPQSDNALVPTPGKQSNQQHCPLGSDWHRYRPCHAGAPVLGLYEPKE